MLDSKILDCSTRLIQLAFDERRKSFPTEISQLKEKLNVTGNLHSGHCLKSIHRICVEEVATRTEIILNSIKCAHKAVGSPYTETLAADIKEQGEHYIEKISEEVSEKMSLEMHFLEREAKHLNLSSATHVASQRFNIDVDLYVDSLAITSENLGSVDTKANTIFISHAAEDAVLAEIIKTQIDDVFQNKIDVFVSSIPGKIKPGSDWLGEIVGNLMKNSAFVVLVTPYSEQRPFVWFEIGFSWLRRLNNTCKIYAICAPPIDPGKLAEPLCRLQAISLADEQQTRVFFEDLTSQFELGNSKAFNFAEIQESLPTYPPKIAQTGNIDEMALTGETKQEDDLIFEKFSGTYTSNKDEIRYCSKCLDSSSQRVPLREQANGWRCSVCDTFYPNPNYDRPTHTKNDYNPLSHGL